MKTICIGTLLMLQPLLLLCLLCGGCTENEKVKTFGGTATTKLPPGQKLVNVTWKNQDLWLLTRQRHPNEVAETYTFSEKSSWGVMEGTFIIVEQP